MRHYWYTFFLLASLVIVFMYVGGKKTYDIWERAYQISAQRQKTETSEIEDRMEESAVSDDLSAKENREAIVGEPDGSTADLTQEEEPEEEEKDAAALFSEGFENVLFIGDSRTVGLYEYGQMEGAAAFADNGMSVFNLWKSQVLFMKEGKKTLEQVLTEKQYRIIHFMLGINELGYTRQQVIKKYREAVEQVQRLQPDARIVLGANLYVTAEMAEKNEIFSNDNIRQLNAEIQNIAQELGCVYVDVNEIFDDGEGNLGKEYSADGAHILGKYYADWVKWLGSW